MSATTTPRATPTRLPIEGNPFDACHFESRMRVLDANTRQLRGLVSEQYRTKGPTVEEIGKDEDRARRLLRERMTSGENEYTSAPITEPQFLVHTVGALTAMGGPAALAGIVVTWLRHRKSKVTLKITKIDGSVVEMGVEGPKDPMKLIDALTTQLRETQELQVEAEDDPKADRFARVLNALLEDVDEERASLLLDSYMRTDREGLPERELLETLEDVSSERKSQKKGRKKASDRRIR